MTVGCLGRKHLNMGGNSGIRLLSLKTPTQGQKSQNCGEIVETANLSKSPKLGCKDRKVHFGQKFQTLGIWVRYPI